MSTTLNETRHTAEFMVSEANGYRSRDTVQLGANDNRPEADQVEQIAAGQVLGRITDGQLYVAHDPSADDGSEVARAVSYAPVDVSDAPQRAVAIVRNAEVAEGALTFVNGTTEAQKADAIKSLAARGIVAR